MTWDDSGGSKNKLSRIHGGNLHRLHVNLEEVATFIQTYASWTEHEGIVYKVSNTSLMFNTNHGGDKMLVMAPQQLIGISISLDFHHHVNTMIALVRPKDVMVYVRGINHE